jgi:hypothetical protein
MDINKNLEKLFVLLEAKIARMTSIFTINNARVTTFRAFFLIINGRIQGLYLLDTFVTQRSIQIMTRYEDFSTL